jgi:hypothetical protein
VSSAEFGGPVGVIEDDDEHKREDREERKGEAGFYRTRRAKDRNVGMKCGVDGMLRVER